MEKTFVALHRRAINLESAEQYELAHQRIPQTVIDVLKRVGIRCWLIFRDGCDLFHLIDCDDYASSMQHFQADPIGRDWQMEMGQLLEPATINVNSISLPIPCIWSFH